MALRRFATDATSRLGLRVAPSTFAEQPNFLGFLASRAYATGVMCSLATRQSKGLARGLNQSVSFQAHTNEHLQVFIGSVEEHGHC